MSDKPFYIVQNGEFASMSVDERTAWFDLHIKQARSEDAAFFRCSVDNNEQPTMALVEGWWKRPEDQGEIRWQLTTNALEKKL